jgi:hypothetical protein
MFSPGLRISREALSACRSVDYDPMAARDFSFAVVLDLTHQAGQTSRMRNLSWWSVGAVALNVPWIWAFGWAIWVIKTNDGPIAGEIFFVPACVWFGSGFPALACGVTGFFRVRRSDGKLRGKWLAVLGVALAAVGPTLAIVSSIIESSHDDR